MRSFFPHFRVQFDVAASMVVCSEVNKTWKQNHVLNGSKNDICMILIWMIRPFRQGNKSFSVMFN